MVSISTDCAIQGVLCTGREPAVLPSPHQGLPHEGPGRGLAGEPGLLICASNLIITLISIAEGKARQQKTEEAEIVFREALLLHYCLFCCFVLATDNKNEFKILLHFHTPMQTYLVQA